MWRRVGDRVLQRPGPALAVTVVAFVAGAFGLIAYKVDYSTTSFFKKSVESVEGFELIEDAFPAGVLYPTTVLVQTDDGTVTRQDAAAAAARREERRRGRVRVPDGRRVARRAGGDGDVILESDPFTKAALSIVPDLRDQPSPTSARA